VIAVFPAHLLTDSVSLSRPALTGEGPVVFVIAADVPCRIDWVSERSQSGNAVDDRLVCRVTIHPLAADVKIGDILTLPDGSTVTVRLVRMPRLGEAEGLGRVAQRVEAW